MRTTTFVSLAALGLALAACASDRGYRRSASAEYSGSSTRATMDRSYDRRAERPMTSGSGSSESGIRPSGGSSTAGASKGEIRRAQEALKAQGLYTDNVDGIMGPNTKEALRQFQAREGLQETAALDRATRQRLASEPTGSSGSSTR